MPIIGKSLTVHTASLSTTLSLANNDGFMVDADGTLHFTARADSTEVELPVKQGVMYPIDVEYMDITNSVTLTTVWIVRGQKH